MEKKGQDLTLCEEELSEVFSEKHKIPPNLPSHPNTTAEGDSRLERQYMDRSKHDIVS